MNWNKVTRICLGLACVGVIGVVVTHSTSTKAATYYVSAKGNDKWSGSISTPNKLRTDGPFFSLERARDEIRKFRSVQKRKEPFRVVIAEGAYPLSQPFVLKAEDSGTKDSQISYESEPNGKPVFSGGKTIQGFKVENGLWVAEIPEVAQGKWYFEQLWVNNRRATRARTPNSGFYLISSQVKDKIQHPNSNLNDLSRSAFIAKPDDIKSLQTLPEDQKSDVSVNIYHSWETSRLPLCCLDLKKNILFFNGYAHWSFMIWPPFQQRYFIENFKQALDQPGEWFLSRKGKLFYKPLANEKINTVKVIAPKVSEFIRFEGEANKKVEFVTIKGLSFRHGQYLTPPQGVSNGQAADSVPGVIMADNVNNISFLDNEIAHTGLYGMWFRRGCKNVKILRNYMHDLGAGGVRVGEGIVLPKESDQTSHFTINNNWIRDGGHVFPGAVGIWIGQSHDNQVTHNEISHFNYTGISVGWTWGYGDSLAKRNSINFNKIHNIGRYVLSDLGGIYTLGISDGTTIKNNLIHDVYSYDKYSRGGWGIYNDQGSSNLVIENNLVYRTKTGGYHINGGKNNIVKNNIFAFSIDGQLQTSTPEDHLSLLFSNNIVYWNKSDLFRGNWMNPKNIRLSKNIFWNSADKTLTSNKKFLNSLNSLAVDPMFLNSQTDDFRFRNQSPFSKINFKPFNYKLSGLNVKLKWAKLY